MDRRQFDDPRWCEAQYNNRLLVANAADFVERWPRWALETRQKLQHDADISYGPHSRETFDFFHAENPRGLFAFIHGGYWRALSKHDFSWIADRLVTAGYSVALINYPLCPDVSVLDIARCSERAICKIWTEAQPRERDAFVVSGHSAGGYLTAHLFAVDWGALGLPTSPFVGGLSISGVFELQPLVHTSMNDQIRLTPETATAWSLPDVAAKVSAPLVLAVGGAESDEFLRQSADQAARWPENPARAVTIDGRNHFDVLEELRDSGSQLFRVAQALLDRV